MTLSITMNQYTAQILRQQRALPMGIIDTLAQRAMNEELWIGQLAVEHGLLSERELAEMLSRHLDLEVCACGDIEPDPAALACLTPDVCRKYRVVPVRLRGDTLVLAAANPLEEAIEGVLALLHGVHVVLTVGPLHAVQAAIDRLYNSLPVGGTAIPRPANTQDQASRLREARGEMHDLLKTVIEHRGSDLHLTVGARPLMRAHGLLQALPCPILTSAHLEKLVFSLLTESQLTQFEMHWELDFAYAIAQVARFRVNLLRQNGHVGAIIRVIPMEVPTLESLGMPAIIRDLATRPRGLVLVTGPTGVGKSTTLAAMVEEINRTRRAHIVTIEDPIEFSFTHKQGEVNQRQIGQDTHSYAAALRHVLRQDPDAILIGEMRDLETIAIAMTAAETGHLVLSTLHTNDTVQAIDRIIDIFPSHRHGQVRAQLSQVLEGIVAQLLIPTSDRKGRVCAQEILVATPAVRTLIREGKTHLLSSVLQSGAKHGMQRMDQALQKLAHAGRITLADAVALATDPELVMGLPVAA